MKPEQIESTQPDTELYDHPAFAVAKLSTNINSKQRHLFGTNIGHRQTLSLSISKAYHERHLNRDRFPSESTPIIEVEISLQQLSNILLSQNRHEGVPVTIRYLNNRRIPPYTRIESNINVARSELKSNLSQQSKQILQTIKELENLDPSPKTKTRELIHHLKCLVQNIPANFNYSLSQLDETLDNTINDLKLELENPYPEYTLLITNSFQLEQFISDHLSNTLSTIQGTPDIPNIHLIQKSDLPVNLYYVDNVTKEEHKVEYRVIPIDPKVKEKLLT